MTQEKEQIGSDIRDNKISLNENSEQVNKLNSNHFIQNDNWMNTHSPEECRST